MNINLVIDQLVLEGMTLSRGERVELEESLRESLLQALNKRAEVQALPESRSSRREQLQLSLCGNTQGAGLGESLGTSLSGHVWDGRVLQLDSQRGKR